MEALLFIGLVVLGVGSLFLLFSGSSGRQTWLNQLGDLELELRVEAIDSLLRAGVSAHEADRLLDELENPEMESRRDAIDELLDAGIINASEADTLEHQPERLAEMVQWLRQQFSIRSPVMERADAQLRREQRTEAERRRATLAPILSKTQKSLQTRPRDGDLHTDLGHFHTLLSEWDQAKNAYEKVLAFDLADERKQALVHLLYGRILARERLPLITDGLTADYHGLASGRYDTIRDFIPSEGLYKSWFRELTSYDIRHRPDRPPEPGIIKHHFDESIRLLERHLKRDSTDIDAMRIVAGLYECMGRTKSRVRMQVLIKEAEIRKQAGDPNPQHRPPDTHEKGVAFEHRCLALLKAMGYEVIHVGTSGDGGIDIRAKDTTPLRGSSIIVQCKDQKQPISEPRVREFYGLVASEGVNKGVFMTTADFTAPARKFAAGKRLELIDGSALEELESRIAHR